MIVNFGSGRNYKKGWINLDVDKKFNPDILIKPGQTHFKSFKDNSVKLILADQCIQFVERKDLFNLIKEFHRILRPGGKLIIYVPHWTGTEMSIFGVNQLAQVNFGVKTFCAFDKRDDSPYTEDLPKFKIKSRLLLFKGEREVRDSRSWFSFLNIFNFLFNWSLIIQQISEKYLWGGFEEIKYTFIKR